MSFLSVLGNKMLELQKIELSLTENITATYLRI